MFARVTCAGAIRGGAWFHIGGTSSKAIWNARVSPGPSGGALGLMASAVFCSMGLPSMSENVRLI